MLKTAWKNTLFCLYFTGLLKNLSIRIPKKYKKLSYSPFLRKSKKSCFLTKNHEKMVKIGKNQELCQKTQNLSKQSKNWKNTKKIAKKVKK